MLRIKVIENIETYIVNYSLAMSENSHTASYPRRFDANRIINDLQKAIENESAEVFTITKNDHLCGLFSCFWDDDSNYLQTTYFLIDSNYENYDIIAEKAITFIKKNKDNYQLYIGVPSENKQAISYLGRFGKLTESSLNTHLEQNDFKYSENSENIISINIKNFHLYKDFHDKHALKLEMYWNGENLQKSIAQFDIFAYIKDDVIIGSILAKKGKLVQEIYGLFSDENNINIYSKLLAKLLCNFASESEKLNVIYFIDEHNTLELNNAKNLGFVVQDIYKCFVL